MGKAPAHEQSNGSQLGRAPLHRLHRHLLCLSTSRFFSSSPLSSTFTVSFPLFFLLSLPRYDPREQRGNATIESYATRLIIKSSNYLGIVFNNLHFRRLLYRNRSLMYESFDIRFIVGWREENGGTGAMFLLRESVINYNGIFVCSWNEETWFDLDLEDLLSNGIHLSAGIGFVIAAFHL